MGRPWIELDGGIELLLQGLRLFIHDSSPFLLQWTGKAAAAPFLVGLEGVKPLGFSDDEVVKAGEAVGDALLFGDIRVWNGNAALAAPATLVARMMESRGLLAIHSPNISSVIPYVSAVGGTG